MFAGLATKVESGQLGRTKFGLVRVAWGHDQEESRRWRREKGVNRAVHELESSDEVRPRDELLKLGMLR